MSQICPKNYKINPICKFKICKHYVFNVQKYVKYAKTLGLVLHRMTWRGKISSECVTAVAPEKHAESEPAFFHFLGGATCKFDSLFCMYLSIGGSNVSVWKIESFYNFSFLSSCPLIFFIFSLLERVKILYFHPSIR